ncbi:MAG: VRR-NUC domain-containing protein [Paludibacteraceae bacterium]|nr:VRR-NUC domain-containing protein [Paludibacteraceae bacterium]MBR3647641.1 VRR-NUC domain-containing protein [Paludibacteraceae bacterium]
MTIAEYKQMMMKKNKGKVAPSEHDLQVACVQRFRYQYPQFAKLLFSIPNGGYRTAKTAAIMKAEGQTAGVPDIFFAVARKGKHGLWIELKNGKAGRLSPLQKEMIALLEQEGYACAVCHSLDEFQVTIQDYL